MGIKIVNGVVVDERDLGTNTRTQIPYTKWQDVWMDRRNAIQPIIDELAEDAVANDIQAHLLVGSMGTGKTTLGRSVSHMLHTTLTAKYNINLQYHELNRYDMANIKEKLKEITTDSIIMFDDVAYLESDLTPKQYKTVLAELTRIRHREGVVGDVRLILWFSIQYSKSLSPFVRGLGAQNTWITGVLNEEIANFAKVVPGATPQRMRDFARIRARARKLGGRWGPPIPSGRDAGKEMYLAKKPFMPALYAMADGIRYIVFPRRDWLSPNGCGVCGFGPDDTPLTPDGSPDVNTAMHQQLDGIKSNYVKNAIPTMRWWCAMRGDKSHVSTNARAVLNKLNKLESAGLTTQHVARYLDEQPDRRRGDNREITI